ncbi:MAG: ParB N-terminal domain-containing protein [Deltaproteobacteria bacterium]|nr:ParB N-terminal domain-containing protein [Deltaproteobacteria bacterium]
MLVTKRYDYVSFDAIQIHPTLANHRGLNDDKVRHYREDILKNGLLEPLVVWERNRGEFFLVGGFHRLNAIKLIRQDKPDYYDRVDVRVVGGDLEEMRALNLKLNADRLDARISEYFDTVIFLTNANWDKAKIAQFLDKSVSFVEEIVRFVPGMDPRIRALLNDGKMSWSRTKAMCRRILEAAPGTEKQVADALLKEFAGGGEKPASRRPLSLRSAAKRLSVHMEKNPKATYTVTAKDLFALLALLGGQANGSTDQYLERVKAKFPGLVD